MKSSSKSQICYFPETMSSNPHKINHHHYIDKTIIYQNSLSLNMKTKLLLYINIYNIKKTQRKIKLTIKLIN